MFKPHIRVSVKDPAPRHAQVQRILREMVATGRLRPGDKIPAEMQLAEALGVSKMTVNKALLVLTANGLFVREVGRGTFVAPEAVQNAVSGADADGREDTGGSGEASASLKRPPVAPSAPPSRNITLSFVEGARNVLESPYYSMIYQGVLDAARQSEDAAGFPVTLHLATLSGQNNGGAENGDPAIDGRLIIAPRAESIAAIESLWGAGQPLVVVGASWPGMGVPSVDSDNVGGAASAVRHLLEQGHRRIALLYAERDTANTQDRIVGYRRALGMAGIALEPEWEICAEQAWKAGDTAMSRMVSLLRGSSSGRNDAPSSVTAIFAAGHYLALEALNAARNAGCSVPEDVSVVGYDDPLSAQLVYPPLTCIRQPLYEMGRRAAERLLELMQASKSSSAASSPTAASVRELLPAALVVRASTVAYRAASV